VCDDPDPKARIVQTEFGNLNQWPGLAVLRVKDYANREEKFFCGGAAVSSTLVVTAAHCITIMGIRKVGADYLDNEGRKFEVILGVDNLNAVRDANVYLAEDVVVHRSFVEARKGHDIALIKLKGEWRGATMPVAKLPPPRSEASVFLRVAGFGATFSGQTQKPYVRPSDSVTFYAHSYRLRNTTLPEVSTERCLNALGEGTIGAAQICAGLRWGGEDTCQGDSGGPIVTIDGDGCARQVGLVSWGGGCGDPARYGVYTRLSAFESWLKENAPANVQLATAPAIALTTLQTELLAQLERILLLAPPVKIVLPNDGKLKHKQPFHIDVRSPVAGRLILIDIDPSHGIHQVFPVENSHVTLKLVPNEVLKIPADKEHYFLALPPGNGQLIAIVVPDKFPYESLVASAELLRRARSAPAVAIGRDEQTEYLINLVDQVVRVLRGTETGSPSDSAKQWAFSKVNYVVAD
jgi:hypothetical protein